MEGLSAIYAELERMKATESGRHLCVGCREAFTVFRSVLERELINFKQSRMQEFLSAAAGPDRPPAQGGPGSS